MAADQDHAGDAATTLDGWIVIPNWSKWQSRSDRSDPWIKDYIDQLDRDEHVRLTLAEHGLLTLTRRLYARHDGQITLATARALIPDKTRTKHWQSLADAGLLEISAAKPPRLSGQSAATSRRIRREFAARTREEVEELRSSTKSTAASEPAQGGSRGRAKTQTPAGRNGPAPRSDVCPECELGGGMHLADCPTVTYRADELAARATPEPEDPDDLF